jgi:hypothetical protein
VELEIGGQIIDTQYGEWMEVLSEMTLPEEKRTGYNKMINKIDRIFTSPLRVTEPSINLLSYENVSGNTWKFNLEITKNDRFDHYNYAFKMVIPIIDVTYTIINDKRTIFSNADETFFYEDATTFEFAEAAAFRDRREITFVFEGSNELRTWLGKTSGSGRSTLDAPGFVLYYYDQFVITEKIESEIISFNMGSINLGETINKEVSITLLQPHRNLPFKYYYVELKNTTIMNNFTNTTTEPNPGILNKTSNRIELYMNSFNGAIDYN